MTSTYTGRIVYSGVHVANSLENGKKYTIQISSNVPGDTKKYYLCKEANHDFLHAREVPDANYPLIEFTATLPSGENRFILSTDAHVSVPTTACLELGLIGTQREVYLYPNATIPRWIYQGSTNALYGVADNQTVVGQVYYDVANDLVTYTNGTVTSDYPVTLNEVIVPAPTAITVSHTAAELAAKYSWSSGSCYRTCKLDYESDDPQITLTIPNTYNNYSGMYSSSFQHWRVYARNSGNFQIAIPNATINSVKITYTRSNTSGNNAKMIYNSSYIDSEQEITDYVSGSKIYVYPQGSSSTSYFASITKIEITYTPNS